MNLPRLRTVSVALLTLVGANAQEVRVVTDTLPEPPRTEETEHHDVVRLRVEGRGDYDTEFIGSDKVKEGSGFRGKFLNLVLTGEFAGKFAYGYRQRLNRFSRDMHFFDATDWLYLSYRPVEPLTLSAGKQMVAVGGYEYDSAPIDQYFYSEFCSNVSCYAWGVTVAYDFRRDKDSPDHDRLLAQVCQSPLDAHTNDLYAYNLMWYGRHAWWSTMWSINAVETSPGRYISYVALGNEFRMGPKWYLRLDLMNRASRHQQWLFADFSVMGELNYRPNQHFRLYGKATYDRNKTHTDRDAYVQAGTELTRLSCGLEYLPLKGRWHDWVRLHAGYSYAWGDNTNPNGALHNRQHVVSAGVTCRVDVFRK